MSRISIFWPNRYRDQWDRLASGRRSRPGEVAEGAARRDLAASFHRRDVPRRYQAAALRSNPKGILIYTSDVLAGLILNPAVLCDNALQPYQAFTSLLERRIGGAG